MADAKLNFKNGLNITMDITLETLGRLVDVLEESIDDNTGDSLCDLHNALVDIYEEENKNA